MKQEMDYDILGMHLEMHRCRFECIPSIPKPIVASVWAVA